MIPDTSAALPVAARLTSRRRDSMSPVVLVLILNSEPLAFTLFVFVEVTSSKEP